MTDKIELIMEKLNDECGDSDGWWWYEDRIEEILKQVLIGPEGTVCKRCGEIPEVLEHCTMYEVRCANRDCPKPSTVGGFSERAKAIDAWDRKQCSHDNKLPNQDLGHTICKRCGQIL